MAAADITTIDVVKQWAPNKDAGKDDVLIRLIPAASQVIEEQTGRVFADPGADVTELLDGSGDGVGGPGDEILHLRHAPLLTLASVKENGVALTTALGYSAVADVLVDLEHGRLIRRAGSTVFLVEPAQAVPGWARGYRNIEVIHRPGYSPVPADIVQVCVELTWLMYRESTRQGRESTARAGKSASLTDQLSQVSRDTLMRYRRFRVAA